jgi:hypothetical protein
MISKPVKKKKQSGQTLAGLARETEFLKKQIETIQRETIG